MTEPIRNSSTDHSRRSSRYTVEILSAEGLWKELGPPVEASTVTSSTASARLRRYRWGTVSVGALLSVLLHLALVGVILRGTAGRPPYQPAPLTEGASASANTDSSPQVTMLMLINEHSISSQDSEDSFYTPERAVEEVVQKQTEQTLLAATQAPKIPQLSGSTDGTDAQAPTAEATGNESGRAMMFGRYMGQIKARIDRAWDYPVDSADTKFSCKVQIRQDIQGNVKEVTLQRCGDDPAWQLSLVQAIQRASPLSAPPEQSVFTEIVTLSFDVQISASSVQTALAE